MSPLIILCAKYIPLRMRKIYRDKSATPITATLSCVYPWLVWYGPRSLFSCQLSFPQFNCPARSGTSGLYGRFCSILISMHCNTGFLPGPRWTGARRKWECPSLVFLNIEKYSAYLLLPGRIPTARGIFR